MSPKALYCGLAGLALAALAPPAFSANLIDMTASNSTQTGLTVGAIYTTNFTQPAGSGVIGSILRVQTPNGQVAYERGYNTSGSPPPLDVKSGVNLHNGDVTIGDLQYVNIGSKSYVPFLLDLNEPSSDPSKYISLDRLTIYVGGTLGTTSTAGLNLVADPTGLTGDVTALGTKVYDMDADFGAPPDQYIKLDSTNAPGSGKFNLQVLIPASLFNGFAKTAAVFLYNVNGVQYAADPGTSADATFEEWSLQAGVSPIIPVPPVALAGLMALGLWAGAKRLRRRTA